MKLTAMEAQRMTAATVARKAMLRHERIPARLQQTVEEAEGAVKATEARARLQQSVEQAALAGLVPISTVTVMGAQPLVEGLAKDTGIRLEVDHHHTI